MIQSYLRGALEQLYQVKKICGKRRRKGGSVETEMSSCGKQANKSLWPFNLKL